MTTMATDASVIELCQRIDAAIGDAADPEVVFRSLLSVMTKRMSFVCADCRKDLAREIRARLPDMLRRANAAAAERERAQEQDHLRARSH
jgi:hypothetical protein